MTPDYACDNCRGTGIVTHTMGLTAKESYQCPEPHVMVGGVHADPNKVRWFCFDTNDDISVFDLSEMHMPYSKDKIHVWTVGEVDNPEHLSKCGWYRLERIEEET